MILTDLALARRLDGAEGAAGAQFVEAHARHHPKLGAQWIRVAGAYVMFDGVGSPCTQTFGLGLFEPLADTHLQEIESFFDERGASTAHDVCPLAGVSVYRMLCNRGYLPTENAQVMFLSLDGALPAHESPVRVRTIEPYERETWARTATQGWAQELPEHRDMLEEFMNIAAIRADAPSFLAEIDGQPVAAAAYFEHERVAIFAGASTIPKWRNRGAQRALLHARLDYAARSGCDLAMVVAEPGSASQRNAERNGFRIAYTRTKWERPVPIPT